MSLLEFVFDPAGFAGGVVVTAIAFSGRSVRGRIQANGVLAKSAAVSSKFKPKYAELEKKLETADERMSVFSFDYHTAYPSGQKNPLVSTGIQSVRNRARESLNLMLTRLNDLDNTNLSAKAINEYAVLLEKNLDSTAQSLRDVNTLLERYEGRLFTSIGKLKELKSDAKIIGDFLKKAQANYADALTRFDRLFLESVPPALFKAEKAYETFSGDLNALIDNVESGRAYATHDSCAPSRSTSLKTMIALKNHLTTVLDYSDIAKSEAAKHRVKLRHCSDYGSGEQYGIDYNAALESLMDAESRPYDKGNPKTEFEDAIKLFRTFVENSKKGVYRSRK